MASLLAVGFTDSKPIIYKWKYLPTFEIHLFLFYFIFPTELLHVYIFTFIPYTSHTGDISQPGIRNLTLMDDKYIMHPFAFAVLDPYYKPLKFTCP